MTVENKFGKNLELRPIQLLDCMTPDMYPTNNVADFVKQFFPHETCAEHRLHGNKNSAKIIVLDSGLLFFLLVRSFLFS